MLPLLLTIPLMLTVWAMLTELSLVTPSQITININLELQQVLKSAEAAAEIPQDEESESQSVEVAALYPDEVFETDWSEVIEPSEILHQNALHSACVMHKNSVVPWTYGRPGQSEAENNRQLINESDPDLLAKLRKCPDVDVFLPGPIRGFGYCEDATAYTKFLESRILPRWVLEVKFEDKARDRSITYHDLCPNTPMVFFNHYWEGLLEAPDWPAVKPIYLMPNVEMYELESEHYWRSDVVLCKTALCARYLQKWFLQEGNPRGTRVLYTRHTTSNLALEVQSKMSPSESDASSKKNFSDVSFLHTVGSSIQKGTRQVLDCWFSRTDMPHLDLYMDQDLYNGAFKDYDDRIKESSNVNVHTGRLTPSEFGRVIAEGQYFLCPSVMEGYGHYINQARSSNAFIVTTDAAPMNELITPSSGALIPASVGAYGEQFLGGSSPKAHALRNVSGLVANFHSDDLCEMVIDIVENMSPEERGHRADRALQQYYFDTVFFAQKMQELRYFARSQNHPSRQHFLDDRRSRSGAEV